MASTDLPPTSDGEDEPVAPAPLPVLSPEDILGRSAALEERWVDVPQWGTRVRVRELTRAEVLHVLDLCTDRRGVTDNEALQQRLFLRCVVEPKFSRPQYEELCKRSSKAFGPITRAIKELNGLDDDGSGADEAVAAAKAAFRDES